MSAALKPMVADPLGFPISLEGVAMLRAFVGEHDRDFMARRIARVTELIAQRDQLGASIAVPAVSAADGYDAWAPTSTSRGRTCDFSRPQTRRRLTGPTLASPMPSG